MNAMLVHYLGHYGNIKALRYFVAKGINIQKTDKFEQTIVHYATRQGRLGILKYLNTLDFDFE